jgi:Protein of unknown function (DUF3489)
VPAIVQKRAIGAPFQLMRSTGWQPHTMRGAIAGMVRKRLGLTVVSARAPVGERAYRIDRPVRT